MGKQIIKGKRILLVDDDPYFGGQLNEHAAMRGVRLDNITSATLAKAWPAAESYDVLVLNCDLEACTGREVAEFLGRVMPKKALVMMTPSPTTWFQDELGGANIKAVISKWDGFDHVLRTALEA